ncbi:pseudouridine synthase [Aliigemmobacter aestuarii]|uniref:Pseudouridine synthase n=1 Tax=Aliigemmobacter aestuarii TaxID=1445661 RepID=A0A4S3MK01_9RHOB|nr:pseudouridine synthase [Gemmobacter aestuarii]THD81556.1 pseudouridine synthase [Gemmobacter aestuarii]
MPRKSSPAKAPPATPAPEGERIAKVMSRSGVASRREAERMIEAGLVKVNGKVIDSPALNVTPRDKITVDGKPLAAPEPARLWLYYKPEGLVTSEADEKGRATVFESLPPEMPRVMSVGRLDLNSEGLLLLTNDGELKRRLELPSTGWLRKYRVRVKGTPTDADLDPLRKGIVADGETFQPMQVVLDKLQGANAWLTVGLREGKNREIRRAMTEIGLTVNRLIRISYGPFRLNDLQPGEVEEVRPRVLKDQLGLSIEEHEAAPPARTRRTATSGARAPAPAPKPATGTAARTAARTSAGTGGSRTGKAPATSSAGSASHAAAKPATRSRTATRGAAASPALRELSETWTKAITPKSGARPARRDKAGADPAGRPARSTERQGERGERGERIERTGVRTDDRTADRTAATKPASRPARPAAKPAAKPDAKARPAPSGTARPRTAAKPAAKSTPRSTAPATERPTSKSAPRKTGGAAPRSGPSGGTRGTGAPRGKPRGKPPREGR